MFTWVLNTPLLFEDSPNVLFFKVFFIVRTLKSIQSYFFLKYFFFKFIRHAEHLTRNAMRCTISIICSTWVSLWKSQHFQRPIYNPVEHLWWSLYCENIKLLIYSQKSSIVDVQMGSKYTFAFWRLFKRFIFLKDFSL